MRANEVGRADHAGNVWPSAWMRCAGLQGQELSAGVLRWTRQAKILQHDITAARRVRYG